MTTDRPNELVAFHSFLGERIASGSLDLSPEESVEAFRSYQRDLERFRQDIAPAIERLERGEPGVPFDIEDIKRRGRERPERRASPDRSPRLRDESPRRIKSSR